VVWVVRVTPGCGRLLLLAMVLMLLLVLLHHRELMLPIHHVLAEGGGVAGEAADHARRRHVPAGRDHHPAGHSQPAIASYTLLLP